MLEARVRIVNRLGLHARAAAQLVKVASAFRSDIQLQKDDDSISADSKSILGILALAASQGTSLKLEIEGDDEKDAMKAIIELFTNGFGEG
jgi:phosphotransferase system HPr (HPr) family protein